MFFKDAKRCDEKVEGAFRIGCIAAVASQCFYEPALTRYKRRPRSTWRIAISRLLGSRSGMRNRPKRRNIPPSINSTQPWV